MAWNYADFADGSVMNVLSDIQNKLNGLSRGEGRTAKLAASDRRKGDALGIVVWDSDAPSPPDMPESTQWGRYVWSTETDYQSMYSGLIDALNKLELPDGAKLTKASAFYSEIAMTNLQGSTATLAIFYRVDSGVAAAARRAK